MKIGILTASRTDNNGTDLQAFAMQTMVMSLGFEAEIIDYGCEKLESSRKLVSIRSLKDFIRFPWVIFMKITHEAFRRKYFHRSEYKAPQNLLLNEYSIIIVGSDQVWNLDVTGKDVNFFLPLNLGNFKRMSYAASIGKIDLQHWNQVYNLSNLLNSFESVSVRESFAVESLKKIHVEAREDLDPIMMIGRDELIRLIVDCRPKFKYVLIYLVEENKKAIEDAVKYGQKNHYKVLMVSTISRPILGVQSKWFVSLPKWLMLMNCAEMVFTNSYHGLSVAITLNTNVRVYSLSKEDCNTRSYSLLNKIEMLELYDECSSEIVSKINWEQVNQKIDVLKMRSTVFLKSRLNKAFLCQ